MSVEYVPSATADDQAGLLTQLRDLLPKAFPDGELDAGALLDVLELTKPDKPSFSFSWPGIEQARLDARMPTTSTLIPDRDASINWDATRDVLVEGDNLQVLKVLKAGYNDAAKLIYIDPPYNTGEAFTYNDAFSVPEPDYLRATNQMDEQGNATTSKIENAGRKHAPWLTMMFPRLAVARHLLRRDGVIVISVDNNEVHHLRLLLDAVFGADNFVDMMTWQGGRKGDAKLTAGGQDYLLIYARDLAYLKQLDVRWRERKTGLELVYSQERLLLAKHKNDFESARLELRAWYEGLPEGNPAKQHSHYDHIDAGGVWTSDNLRSPSLRENLRYTYKGYSPPEKGWAVELSVMEELDRTGHLVFPGALDGRIREKKYLKDQENWAPASSFYRDRSAASAALTTLMGARVFDNPKNTDVLARLISAITNDGDLVVDFFAGSGSTGHAVWEQNRTDGKSRRWLLVQAPEAPDDTEESGKKALQAGYTTIFELAADRLRRAAELFQEDTFDAPELGFRVFRARPTSLVIEPPIAVTESMTGDQYVQASLVRAEGESVVQGADPFAVAWEVVLKASKTQLDASVTEHDIGGVAVYEFGSPANSDNNGRLFVSLDVFNLATADELKLTSADTLILRGDKVDDSVTLTLAPRMPSRLVLLERVPREISL